MFKDEESKFWVPWFVVLFALVMLVMMGQLVWDSDKLKTLEAKTNRRRRTDRRRGPPARRPEALHPAGPKTPANGR